MGIYSTGKQTMFEINRDKQGNGVPSDPLPKQLGADFSQIEEQSDSSHINAYFITKIQQNDPTITSISVMGTNPS